jgi:hypothetical protein
MGVWGLAGAFAAPISLFVLAVFFYWFAIADRYRIFLYYHDMGRFVPDTSPFSAVTSSRYWMAGLVVSGAVMLFYVAANGVLGRVSARYRSPAGWRVWLLCALLLALGIPLLTMTVNRPLLPLFNAAQVTFATLIGLALVLFPGAMAAAKPRDLAWLALDGVALMFVLTGLVGLQYVGRWLDAGAIWRVWMMMVVVAGGILGLLITTGLCVWRRFSIPSSAEVFAAGLCVAYLLMPLLHHLFFTDGYHYITDSDNFFARSFGLKILAWSMGAALAFGVTSLRRSLLARPRSAELGSA